MLFKLRYRPVFRIMKKQKKTITYDELIKGKGFGDYAEETEYILGLIEAGRISPVKASGTNGKKPAMFCRYHLLEEKCDHSGLLDEVRFRLSPRISPDHYLKHPEVYITERSWVLPLSRWLSENNGKDITELSVNERSFEIWSREKFLSGKKEGSVSSADILKHCGITMEDLKVYRTAEPFSYYTLTSDTPQTVLILENLDPFYGMRKYLLEGNKTIAGVETGTLVYGGGKRVVSSFRDFELSAEPYLCCDENRFLYAGDLDYEGIGIYESLCLANKDKRKIELFTDYYRLMLNKAKDINEPLPPMKEGQNEVSGGSFFGYFSKSERKAILKILEEGRYIPQEILTVRDYGRGA